MNVYTDNLSLYNTLDADGVVQPKEVGAAVQELRKFYHDGTLGTITWLRAHGQLADALAKHRRDTPLQQTIRTGASAVRLAATDYLTKRSSAAPGQDRVMDDQADKEADACSESRDEDDGGNKDGDMDKGEYE